jgi:hypothetical protein
MKVASIIVHFTGVQNGLWQSKAEFVLGLDSYTGVRSL